MVGRELDGPLWAVLGRSRGLWVQSCAALGASEGGLGPLSGPMWSDLSCLGAYVGGLGPLSGPLRAVLARDQGEKWPFLEREGDQDRGSGRKVAQTRAGAGSERVRGISCITGIGLISPHKQFFSRYTHI